MCHNHRMNHPTPFLIVGACGMLGRATARLLGARATALTFADLDITDPVAVAAALSRHRPTTLINCAAATDVDRCETDHAYADAGNVEGPRYLAEACAKRGIRMVHVSTDFVFDGVKGAPYTEEDEPAPLGYYGLSKLRGEAVVRELLPEALVVRTSWVYGPVGPAGSNFPLKVLEWTRRPGPLRVAVDQLGSPTYAPHLAEGILELVRAGATGLFHLAGEGCTSRWEFAREVLAAARAATGAPAVEQESATKHPAAKPWAGRRTGPSGDSTADPSAQSTPPQPEMAPAKHPAAPRLMATDFAVEVLPAHAADFPAPAPRPLFSCLDCGKAARLGVTLPPWQDGVALYLAGLLREEDPAVDTWGENTPAGCAPARGAPTADPGEMKGKGTTA